MDPITSTTTISGAYVLANASGVDIGDLLYHSVLASLGVLVLCAGAWLAKFVLGGFS